MSLLEIEHLTKKFGTQVVIDNVSFSVEEHSVFGFLGQNGAGKTTTMKMILGLLNPDEGNIKICNEKVTYGQTKTNQYIGYLSDVPEFYGYMNAMEYLNLCGEITGLKKAEIKKKSVALLELVGLEKVTKRIHSYSRGMKQRLGIAQALLNDPKLLICDEPTSALDPVGRREILDILSKAKEKTTVVFSTHILSDVEQICDQIALLHNGKIVLDGSIEELKKNKKSDTLLIEFLREEDAVKFLQVSNVKTKCAELVVDGVQIRVSNHGIMELQLELLGILFQHELTPIRMEILEPTLENLYMEAIS